MGAHTQALLLQAASGGEWDAVLKQLPSGCCPSTTSPTETVPASAHCELCSLLAVQAAAAPLPVAAAAACALSHHLPPLDAANPGNHEQLHPTAACSVATALSRPGMLAAIKRCAKAEPTVGQLVVAAADALPASEVPERMATEVARQLAPALPAALTALAQAAKRMSAGAWAVLLLREVTTLLQMVASDAAAMDVTVEDGSLPYSQILTGEASHFLAHLTMQLSSVVLVPSRGNGGGSTDGSSGSSGDTHGGSNSSGTGNPGCTGLSSEQPESYAPFQTSNIRTFLLLTAAGEAAMLGTLHACRAALAQPSLTQWRALASVQQLQAAHVDAAVEGIEARQQTMLDGMASQLAALIGLRLSFVSAASKVQMPCRLVPRLLLGLPIRPASNFDDLFQCLKPQACIDLHAAASAAIAALMLLPTAGLLPAVEHADALCTTLYVTLNAMRGLLRCGAALPPLSSEGAEALAKVLEQFESWQSVSQPAAGGGVGGGSGVSGQTASNQGARLRNACAWGSDLIGYIFLTRLQHGQSGCNAPAELTACAKGLTWLMGAPLKALVLPVTAPGFIAAPLPSLFDVLAFVQGLQVDSFSDSPLHDPSGLVDMIYIAVAAVGFALNEANMWGEMQRPAGLEGKELLLPTVRKASQLLMAAEADTLQRQAAAGAAAVLVSALRVASGCVMRLHPPAEAAEAVQVACQAIQALLQHGSPIHEKLTECGDQAEWAPAQAAVRVALPRQQRLQVEKQLAAVSQALQAASPEARAAAAAATAAEAAAQSIAQQLLEGQAAEPRPAVASKAARKWAARAARKAAASTEPCSGQDAAGPTHTAAAVAEPDASPAQCTAAEHDVPSPAAAVVAGTRQNAISCDMSPTIPQVSAAAQRAGDAVAQHAPDSQQPAAQVTEAEWSICPLSKEVMKDPVLLVGDNRSYERMAIVPWLKDHNTSPVTGELLANKDIMPNYTLRSIIDGLSSLQM